MADTEAKWYILHTYSGYENKVANDIVKVVENRNLQNVIEEVYLPVEMTKQTKENGKEVEVERILKNGTNYIKIRDIAKALDLDVSNKGNIAILNHKQ